MATSDEAIKIREKLDALAAEFMANKISAGVFQFGCAFYWPQISEYIRQQECLPEKQPLQSGG